jgi:hypothetical protein
MIIRERIAPGHHNANRLNWLLATRARLGETMKSIASYWESIARYKYVYAPLSPR